MERECGLTEPGSINLYGCLADEAHIRAAKPDGLERLADLHCPLGIYCVGGKGVIIFEIYDTSMVHDVPGAASERKK